MKTKIIYVFSIFLVIICSSLIFTQSSYHRNNSNHPLSINDYLVSDYESKSSTDFIRIDSLISTSIQGTSSKILFQYNDNNKIKEWLMLQNGGSGWFNSYKNELFYDEQNNLVTEIDLDWNSNEWDSSSRRDYSYEVGMLSQSVFQDYNNNSWENSSRYNYVYDYNQNLSSVLTENWINNNWQNSTLTSNYYSTQNRKDSILFKRWINDEWQNYRKSIFYYSNNAIDLDSLIAKSWNGSTWLNIVKREIVNDINHNQIVQIEKIWNSNSWINSIIRYFAYNKYNCIESASCEIWVNDQWTIGDGDILFQNPDGFIIGFITNDISAYYSNIVSVRDKYNSKITGYFLSQNYPNPFNPTTTITYSLPKSTRVTLKVYDIIGREVAELVNEKKESGTYDVTWNGQNIPSGVYFYKITAGEYSKTIKMILLK